MASGRSAKRDRKVERLTEAVAQAHDRLHKDDVDGCHNLLHQALGSGEIISDVAPLADVQGFDQAFRDLCIRTGARASYVLAMPAGEKGTRLLSGGDAEIDAFVTKAMR